MFHRFYFKHFDDWAKETKRKPLVLRGARQVGKSSIVREWVNNTDRQLMEINFETSTLNSLASEVINIQNVIQEIQFKFSRQINPAKDVIFFDEIQKSPKALLALRYFYEQRPDLLVVGAGSLLDFALIDDEVSFPVGRVQFLYIGPVFFSDFLKALGKSFLAEEILETPFEKINPLADKELKDLYLLYLSIGGMPESLQTYIETKDFFKVRKVQKSILETYMADFNKYAKGKQIDYCEQVFNFVPGNIGKKIKYSEIASDNKSRELKKAIHLLSKARVLLPVKHSNATSIPLQSFVDESIYKLFFLDVGLVAAAMNERIENILSTDSFLTGSLAEQFVAQHLSTASLYYEDPLFYWLRDKSKSKAELDFLIQSQNKILPIEVKSGESGHLRSLHIFMSEHLDIKTAIKISSQKYEKSTVPIVQQVNSNRKDFELINLPLWYIERILEV